MSILIVSMGDQPSHPLVLSQLLVSLQSFGSLSFDVPLYSGPEASSFQLLGIVHVSDDANRQDKGTEKGQLRLDAAQAAHD